MTIVKAVDNSTANSLWASLPADAQARLAVIAIDPENNYRRLNLTKVAREFVPTLAQAVGIADMLVAFYDGMDDQQRDYAREVLEIL